MANFRLSLPYGKILIFLPGIEVASPRVLLQEFFSGLLDALVEDHDVRVDNLGSNGAFEVIGVGLFILAVVSLQVLISTLSLELEELLDDLAFVCHTTLNHDWIVH